MKTAGNTFQAVFLVFIFFLISGTACETKSTEPGKNPEEKAPSDSSPANDTIGYFWEVEADDTQKVINDTLQGIRFNFSLLDQDSVPSTVFPEGYNFVFSFLAENTRKGQIWNLLINTPKGPDKKPKAPPNLIYFTNIKVIIWIYTPDGRNLK
jgi:hypothetical protein